MECYTLKTQGYIVGLAVRHGKGSRPVRASEQEKLHAMYWHTPDYQTYIFSPEHCRYIGCVHDGERTEDWQLVPEGRGDTLYTNPMWDISASVHCVLEQLVWSISDFAVAH